jgi:hypothetical protein
MSFSDREVLAAAQRCEELAKRLRYANKVPVAFLSRVCPLLTSLHNDPLMQEPPVKRGKGKSIKPYRQRADLVELRLAVRWVLLQTGMLVPGSSMSCRVSEEAITQLEMAAATIVQDLAEVTPQSADADSRTAAVNDTDLIILRTLAANPLRRFTIRRLWTDCKRRVSEKTIGLRLNSLIEAGYVERGNGGVAITEAGKRLCAGIHSRVEVAEW